jgi:hypothetical protein
MVHVRAWMKKPPLFRSVTMFIGTPQWHRLLEKEVNDQRQEVLVNGQAPNSVAFSFPENAPSDFLLHSFPCIPKGVVGPGRSSEEVRHVVDAERPSLVLEDVEGVPESRPEDHPLDVDGESVDLEKFIIEAFQCYRPAPVAM